MGLVVARFKGMVVEAAGPAAVVDKDVSGYLIIFLG
jgi:hypothetical protein